VHGQTSDLDVVLLEARTGPLERRLRDQLAEADRLVESENARVAFWFLPVPDRDAVDVIVSVRETNRVLIRRVGPGNDSVRVGSATLEEAALVVRGSLQALIEGAQVGVTREEAVAEHEEQEQEQERVEQPPPPPPPMPKTRGHLSPFVGAAVELGIDGKTPLHFAPRLELGLVWGQLALNIAGAFGLSRQVRDASVLMSMARHTLWAAVGCRLELGPAVVTPALGAGATLYRRRTLQTATGVQATPDHITVAPGFGPEVRIELVPGSGWIAVQLTLAAHVVPGAPDFGYEDGTQFRELRSAWYIQPVGNVGVRVFLDPLGQEG
jgi:hypothetical protein